MAIHPPARGAGRALHDGEVCNRPCRRGSGNDDSQDPSGPDERRPPGSWKRLAARSSCLLLGRDRPDGSFRSGWLPRRAAEACSRYSGGALRSPRWLGTARGFGSSPVRLRPRGRGSPDERRGPTRETSRGRTRTRRSDTRPRVSETREAIQGSSTAFPPMWIVVQRAWVGFVLRARCPSGRVSSVSVTRTMRDAISPQGAQPATPVIIARQLCERSALRPMLSPTLSPMPGEQRGLRSCPRGVAPGRS